MHVAHLLVQGMFEDLLFVAGLLIQLVVASVFVGGILYVVGVIKLAIWP